MTTRPTDYGHLSRLARQHDLSAQGILTRERVAADSAETYNGWKAMRAADRISAHLRDAWPTGKATS